MLINWQMNAVTCMHNNNHVYCVENLQGKKRKLKECFMLLYNHELLKSFFNKIRDVIACFINKTLYDSTKNFSVFAPRCEIVLTCVIIAFRTSVAHPRQM